MVVIDEAYAGFGCESALPLVDKYENLVVVRTLSKSHSLAGLRAAYAVAQPGLIEALERVRDSFNSYPTDTLCQHIAAKALLDTQYYASTSQNIVETREQTRAALASLGFTVTASKANFLFISHPRVQASTLYRMLRDKNILVRYFAKPRIENWLRVTIGTQSEMLQFVKETKELLALLDVVD